MLQYHDTDLNTPELEAGLFNPGLENRFVTSLSRPSRPRGSSWRFTNAGAAAAGAYVPAAPIPVTRSDELNVAYFMSPPDFFRDDGYIARISVDLSATEFSPEELVVTYSEPAFWIVACDVPGSSMTGLVQSTFDFPHPPGTGGIDFWVTVPEPAGVAFWLCGVAICRRRRM